MTPVRAARDVVATAHETQVSFLAASIAYYMLVSLFPLGLLALAVATALGGEAFADRVVGAVETVLSDSAAGVLRSALLEGAGRGGATVVGLAVLLWSGLRVFRGLDVAFSLIYGTDVVEGLLGQVRDALTAVAGITVAVLAIAAVNAAIAVSGADLAGLLGHVALVGMLAIAFLPLYYVFPDVSLPLRAVLPGTVFAALGWTVLGAAFSLYASVASGFEVYGAVGGVLLLVTWFYFGSAILLLGAVVNVVAGRDRQLQQATGHTVSPMPVDDGDTGETPPPDGADEDRPGEEADRRSREAGAADVAQLRADFEAFREDVEERTLHREDVESDLRKYVRRRVRRGHARGWGPYLVLLYGTVMTLGAFFSPFLQGGWAVFAMVVIWLSTLGLYVLMLIVGIGLGVAGLPGKVIDRIR